MTKTPPAPAPSPADTDLMLVERTVAGDQKAFELLVIKYQRRIERLIGRMVRDTDLIEDIAQETFIRAYRALAQFRGEAQFYTWLYRIAVNTALNALRSGKRGAVLHQRSGAEAAHVGGRPEALGHGAPSPAQRAEHAGEIARVLAAVAELSPALRVTLVLATVEELPHKQIAEILDIPEGTVAWRVNEARRLLKLRLSTTEPATLAK